MKVTKQGIEFTGKFGWDYAVFFFAGMGIGTLISFIIRIL